MEVMEAVLPRPHYGHRDFPPTMQLGRWGGVSLYGRLQTLHQQADSLKKTHVKWQWLNLLFIQNTEWLDTKIYILDHCKLQIVINASNLLLLSERHYFQFNYCFAQNIIFFLDVTKASLHTFRILLWLLYYLICPKLDVMYPSVSDHLIF